MRCNAMLLQCSTARSNDVERGPDVSEPKLKELGRCEQVPARGGATDVMGRVLVARRFVVLE